MKPAIIITDMLEDFIRLDGALPVGEEGLKIIPNLRRLAGICHQNALPLVYANDALVPDDFLFQGRMKPHALRGTAGARVIDELKPQPSDLIVDKTRFSAFFKTNLDITLRESGIDTIVLGGVATEVCILSTAYEGLCHGFYTIVLEDCCASRFIETHEKAISVLKKSAMYPLLQVMALSDFIDLIP